MERTAKIQGKKKKKVEWRTLFETTSRRGALLSQ
jgi:hypothetical protein